MKNIKIKMLSVVICVLFTFGVVLAIKGFSFVVDIVEDFRGYDYGPKIEKQYNWIGPKPGEIIESNYLMNSDGITLSELLKNDLILLTVVDPGCGACKQTQEQFKFLDENLEGKGIDRFIVSFSKNVSPQELAYYVKSLDLSTKSLVWTNGLENVLPSITAIAYPSHILIDSKGMVIKSFPGTSNEQKVRDRMVRQVLKEVIAEKEGCNL